MDGDEQLNSPGCGAAAGRGRGVKRRTVPLAQFVHDSFAELPFTGLNVPTRHGDGFGIMVSGQTCPWGQPEHAFAQSGAFSSVILSPRYEPLGHCRRAHKMRDAAHKRHAFRGRGQGDAPFWGSR